jgi:hypothetical protein
LSAAVRTVPRRGAGGGIGPEKVSRRSRIDAHAAVSLGFGDVAIYRSAGPSRFTPTSVVLCCSKRTQTRYR